MAEFENIEFTNESISLDGTVYKGCTFTDFELLIGGSAPFSLTKYDVTGCRWTFTGAAALTINILASLYQTGPQMQKLVEETFENIRGRGNEGITMH